MQTHPLGHTASSQAVPAHGARTEPVGRGQERQRQANDDDIAPARMPDHEPSSAADMTESAAAVLDRLREVAAAHDHD